jgi:hypothetical protein
MKWSAVDNLLGWSLAILGAYGIIKFDTLTIEWVFSFVTFVWGTNYWNSARLHKIEEQFMID